MTRIFAAGLAFAVSIGALAACDNKAPSKPLEPVVAEVPVPVVAAPVPQATLSIPELLAALDPDGLCSLFNRAVAPKDKKITRGDCVFTATATDIALTTKDGRASMTASIAAAGSVVTLSAATVSPNSVEDKKNGGWTNVGAVFAGQGGATGICMTVEYFSPNGENNSLFIARSGEKDAKVFRLKPDASKLQTLAFGEPVIAAGTTNSFAILRREMGVTVKSASFAACQ